MVNNNNIYYCHFEVYNSLQIWCFNEILNTSMRYICNTSIRFLIIEISDKSMRFQTCQ